MDERDLLENMLGKQWHPFIILKDIVERVPQYVYKIKKREKEGTLYFSCQPNYNLNAVYDLTLFKENSEVCKAFACQLLDQEEIVLRQKKKKDEELKRLERDAERLKGQVPEVDQDVIDKVDDERFKKYLIIISDNSCLLFERPPFERKEDSDSQIEINPADLTFTMGKLILWGTITAIEQLKRNMEFKDNISIVWSKPVKNEDEFEFNDDNNEELEEEVKNEEEQIERVYETRVQIPNSDDFMMVVLDRMNKIKETTNELKKRKILSMEVTSDSIKGKNINALLHKIAIFEREYEQKKSKEFAQDLMDLYKKVIEYYSAIGNDEYKKYLDKNHTLMENMPTE